MKLFKTIRMDASDSHVFERAAGTDEWAIPGGFSFAHLNEGDLKGKAKQAFSNGFLSLESFGHSTFVSVSELTAETRDKLVASLTRKLLDDFGAPSKNAAEAAALDEINFGCELCTDNPINTLFTLRRFFDEDGAIREEFRIVTPPSAPAHARIWEIVEE